jgi:hypothetical protein
MPKLRCTSQRKAIAAISRGKVAKPGKRCDHKADALLNRLALREMARDLSDAHGLCGRFEHSHNLDRFRQFFAGRELLLDALVFGIERFPRFQLYEHVVHLREREGGMLLLPGLAMRVQIFGGENKKVQSRRDLGRQA